MYAEDASAHPFFFGISDNAKKPKKKHGCAEASSAYILGVDGFTLSALGLDLSTSYPMNQLTLEKQTLIETRDN